MANFDKHIWEGWLVRDFVDELEPSIRQIMTGGSWVKPFTTKAELAQWCIENQPYFKKRIPEVINYFAEMYRLK